MTVGIKPLAPAERRHSDVERIGHTGFGVLLVVWIAALFAINQWGGAINNRLTTKVLAPPLFGRFEFDPSWWLILPAALAVLVIGFGRRAERKLPWRSLLTVAAIAAFAWAVALALVDGPTALWEPLDRRSDYLANLPLAGGVGDFLAGYARNIEAYSVHAEGHPPGALLFLWGLDRLGLGGAVPAAVLILIAAASTVPAVLVSVREVAGEELGRRAAPFLVLTPAVVWMATSMDSLFMAVGAWGICLMAVSMKRRGARSDMFAITSGAVLGAGLFMSYGFAPLGLLVIALGVGLRRVRPLLVAGCAVLLVTGIFAAFGFWWFGGLDATLERYELGVASQRGYAYFLAANLAALSVALGPAVLAGLGRLRHRGMWILCGGALAAVVVSDLSGLSRGEVERIWLPFVPWLTIAAASISPAGTRMMLAAQGSVALAIQVGVRTPW